MGRCRKKRKVLLYCQETVANDTAIMGENETDLEALVKTQNEIHKAEYKTMEIRALVHYLFSGCPLPY